MSASTSNTPDTVDKKKIQCARCGYSTDRKSNLMNHLNKKIACKVKLQDISIADLIKQIDEKHTGKLETVLCEFCNIQVTKANYSRHKKSCKDKPDEPVNIDITTLKEQLTEEITKKVREELQLDFQTQLQQYVNQSSNQGTVITNITNNLINVQANITLNTFGNEDVSHLTHDFLSHCLLNPTKGFPSLIDSIHYNTDAPQNHNLRFKSSKKSSFEKYVDTHWIECDASNTLDELIRKGYKILNAHYMEHFMNDPEVLENEIKQRAFERFRFLSDKTCNDYHSMKRELRLIVKDRTMYILALTLNEA